MTNKTNVNSMEQLLESLEFIGGWQWDVIKDANLEIDELEYIKDYCSDLDEFAKKIEDQDYRIYECDGYIELAEQMEQESIIDIQDIIESNDCYFDYEQLDRDLSCGGDWSEMAYNDAKEILEGYNKYIDHLPSELQEQIEEFWENGSDMDYSLAEEISEWIEENEHTDEWKREYMEEIVNNSDAEWLARYFDYETYGRDVVYDGQFYETNRGFIEII